MDYVLGCLLSSEIEGEKNKKQVQTETNYSISMAHFTLCPQAASSSLRAYLKGLGRSADICWLSSDKV